MAIDRATRESMNALPSRGRKGVYRPRNPDKYTGEVPIIYRSSLELSLMRRLDEDPSVLKWASEPLLVPWEDPRTGRQRRYIPDFLVQKRNPQGVVETLLIEIKPRKQSPDHTKMTARKPGKSKRTFLAEAMTLAQNERKWAAARRLCAARGWRFVVLTERELGLGR